MRETLELNEKWMFHKGDIKVPRPYDKGPAYSQSKTERKRIGPASYYYFDDSDNYVSNIEVRSEGWLAVNLPHDYIIDQDNCREQNNAHGYFKYDNAWYRKHFSVDPSWENKRVTLQFDGIAGSSVI